MESIENYGSSCSSSGIEWIKQFFDKGKKLEDANDTPRHLISLDGKVASAITYVLTQAGPKDKSLLSRITMKMQDELDHRSRLLSGRHALLMMAQSFTTADDTETYLGIEHVANLPMLNNDLDHFWLTWNK